MRFLDTAAYGAGAWRGHRLRAGLSLASVAVGIAAVIALTGMGEGARRYVTKEFMSLGTNLLIVIPGKVETTGAIPWGGLTHDLTLDDYDAVLRRVPLIRRATPLLIGSDTLRAGGLARSVPILGTNSQFRYVRSLELASGQFLSQDAGREGRQEVVLGGVVAREIFAGRSALGQFVRMGPYRFRVVGVLSSSGQGFGINVDEMALIPIETAMRIWDKHSLFRILAEVRSNEAVPEARLALLALFEERHRAQDVTVFTQDSVASAFSAIFQALTLALAGIASVSLAVAGVGIMNVMLVSVTERRAEIGLLKALGATRRQVLRLFLTETVMLALAGGVGGLALGLSSLRVLRGIYPAFPAYTPVWAVVSALGLSAGVGLLFGLWPAYRATKLDPVASLSRR